ncbi:MAG: sialate O-acetylesterase [Fuerstiella sp.]|nr:sialate O-acetylesterase [Fuerstiella sp.]
MKCYFLPTAFSLLAASFINTCAVRGDVKLPAVLDSHMVVQRDQPVRIWGWAEAGEEVTVTLAEETQKTVADGAGRWLVELKAQEADGKPRQIRVVGKNTIDLEDVLVGEVWIGSGQSNMEWQLKNTTGSAEAIAAADHADVRLFHVPKVQADKIADDVNAKWKACTPENVPTFSAVLYYFGKRLHDDLNVPIGLINSSWGGSPIEPWTIKGGNSGGMYNGMIAPLTNVAVKGAIWYQGETNVIRKNKLTYADKMKDLIEGWRKEFRNDELAFHFVQIAPWSGERYEPGQLPALWEAQVATLKIPHTGMAVTTDLVDNIADIHPRNKLDVGNRLALWALAGTYGRRGMTYSGPLYKSLKIDGSTARLTFAHADGMNSRDGNPLREFQIAGESGEFVDATAEIDGNVIVVSAESVATPTQVRFGWHKLANPNLINGAGLPASPFQTDNWRGGTGRVIRANSALTGPMVAWNPNCFRVARPVRSETEKSALQFTFSYVFCNPGSELWMNQLSFPVRCSSTGVRKRIPVRRSMNATHLKMIFRAR